MSKGNIEQSFQCKHRITYDFRKGGFVMYGPHYIFHSYPLPFYPKHSLLQADSPFPPVNTEQLHTSAKRFESIMREVDLFIEKLLISETFATELMDAAQLSDHNKVNELILSAGVTVHVKTNFNPTGIQIEFDNTEQGEGCCKLTISLLW